MNKLAALAVLVIPLAAASAAAENCKPVSETVAGTGGTIKKVVIAAGAGDLVIKGEDGQSDVRVKGRACASSGDRLDGIRLESRRDGSTVYLQTILPPSRSKVFDFSTSYLDLTISIPESAAVSVEDSSGDLHLKNVRSATLVDGSGDVFLRDVAGDLRLVDSSGDVRVANVRGNVHLEDNSGDVGIVNVSGDVEIAVDGSGDLRIGQVAGSVRIDNDGSGDIGIRDVQRDVTIGNDGSGGIRVGRVGGDFTVHADGSGDISYGNVLGSVHIPGND